MLVYFPSLELDAFALACPNWPCQAGHDRLWWAMLLANSICCVACAHLPPLLSQSPTISQRWMHYRREREKEGDAL